MLQYWLSVLQFSSVCVGFVISVSEQIAPPYLNSQDFVAKDKILKVDDIEVQTLYDVSALFTSVSVDGAPDVVKEQLEVAYLPKCR